MEVKRLYRSKDNKIFAGVIGGLGEYLNVDPVLLRVFWIALLIFSAIIPGLLVYLLVLFIMPPHPEEGSKEHSL